MYVFYIFPNLYIYYICNHHVVKSDYWNDYILGVNGALPLGDTLRLDSHGKNCLLACSQYGPSVPLIFFPIIYTSVTRLEDFE